MLNAKTTQDLLAHQLLRHKSGLTVGALAEKLNITRTAVRQHLLALESDGVVARGETRPSGGRPEHSYILAEKGRERFPRQYSWLAELLLQTWTEGPDGALEEKLNALGRKASGGLNLPGAPGSAEQIGALAEGMTGLGYDAETRTENGETVIEAYNCVFHKLAEKNPAVCKFDLALMSQATGCAAEQTSCMVRGGNCCRFRFHRKS